MQLLNTHFYRRSRCWEVVGRAAICKSYPASVASTALTQVPKVNNEFQANKEPTIGAAFLTQKCRLEDRILRYEIWDTAGQERFHSLAVRHTLISSCCPVRPKMTAYD
jgi:hypothetical protein